MGMTTRVFIDGAAGTTGLEIRERLSNRRDLALATLDDARRKDASARSAALNNAGIVILCLPDDAARQAVSMIENPEVRVIDASTAHRTAPGWVYGIPEMDKTQRAAIASAMRLSNPGCWPQGLILLLRPLIGAGLVPAGWPVTYHGVSGYSGGGRSMIAEFEDKSAPNYAREVVRAYALSLEHKHVEEMRMHSGLQHRPLFAPAVGRFYRGMLAEIPLQLWALPGSPKLSTLYEVLCDAYRGEKLVEVASLAESAAKKTLDAEELKDTNRIKLYVFGNEARGEARLAAVYDNLGKGAAGAAVQNLNIMMGASETGSLL